jgi:hypothetical protein
MGVDLVDIAARLQAQMAELAAEEDAAEASTAPVTPEQDALGRLSRIDAMQMQAMAWDWPLPLISRRLPTANLCWAAAAIGRSAPRPSSRSPRPEPGRAERLRHGGGNCDLFRMGCAHQPSPTAPPPTRFDTQGSGR